MKLNEEQREELRELLGTEALKSIFGLLEMCCVSEEQKLLTEKLDAERPNRLLVAKARAEGARSVQAQFSMALDALKMPKK